MDFDDYEQWAAANEEDLSAVVDSTEEARRESLTSSGRTRDTVEDFEVSDGAFERMRAEVEQFNIDSDDDWDDIDYYFEQGDGDDEDESSEYYSVANDSFTTDSSLSVEEIQETQGVEEVEQTQEDTVLRLPIPDSQDVIFVEDVAPTQRVASMLDRTPVAPGATELNEANLTNSQIQQRLEQLQEEWRRLQQIASERNIHVSGIPNPSLHERQRTDTIRRRIDRGPSPSRNVRRRRATTGVQQRIDTYLQNYDIGDIQGESTHSREPQRRQDINRVQVPQNPDELYSIWEQTVKTIVPDDASIYSNFKFAFGDESQNGESYRKCELTKIAKVLFDFKRTRIPGQQAILKGREREGKTGALFSIALAALILRMRVVILCAPNKVAPVVDMVTKLRRAGFSSMFDIKHTLGKKATEDNRIPSAESGQIFVAALGTLGDLKKVKSYIDGERRGGHMTITLLDECDELTQGKGHKSIEVAKN